MKKMFKKYLIKEDIDPEVEPYVKLLFRLIESEKKNKFKRSELLDLIKKFSFILNISPNYELYLLELYALNYRSDGDYTNLTKDNFIDPRKQFDPRYGKLKKTPNYKANKFTAAKIPFQGSNLKAYWEKDRTGELYYVVKSYGWYPIYLFKDNRWYENYNRYSSSTGKQMGQSHPISRWNSEIDERTILVSKSEMDDLMESSDFEDIMKFKQMEILKKESELISSKIRTFRSHIPPVNIKFKVKSIKNIEGKVDIDVDIYDVLKREGNTAIPTPENYLKGEIENVDKDIVENALLRLLTNEFKEFLGTPSKSSDFFQFNFNHLKS